MFAISCSFKILNFYQNYERSNATIQSNNKIRFRPVVSLHSSAHKTQLRFPSDSIDTPQYFQYVLCKEIQHIECWYRYQKYRSITG